MSLQLGTSVAMDLDQDMDLDFGAEAVPDPPVASGTPRPKKARTGSVTGVQGKYVPKDGKRWCKAHAMLHAAEEFGTQDLMCRDGKQAYEGAMTQAKNQGEVKFLKDMCVTESRRSLLCLWLGSRWRPPELVVADSSSTLPSSGCTSSPSRAWGCAGRRE